MPEISHWGILVRNFPKVNPPSEQFDDFTFELEAERNGRIWAVCKKWEPLPKGTKLRITFEDPTGVTIKDNREIGAQGNYAFPAAIIEYAETNPADSVIVLLKSYSLLRSNCQNFVNDLIGRIEDTRPHLQKLTPNKPRRTLGNALNWLDDPRESFRRASPRVPLLEPPQRMTHELRVQQWYERLPDADRSSSWGKNSFDEVWSTRKLDLEIAYGQAMKKKEEEADMLAKMKNHAIAKSMGLDQPRGQPSTFAVNMLPKRFGNW